MVSIGNISLKWFLNSGPRAYILSVISPQPPTVLSPRISIAIAPINIIINIRAFVITTADKPPEIVYIPTIVAVIIIETQWGQPIIVFKKMAGGTYRFGLAQANFDWIGCIPAMIVAAIIFIPYYWKAGVYTVPEFLGRRYNVYVQSIQAFLWVTFLAFVLGIILWATAIPIILTYPFKLLFLIPIVKNYILSCFDIKICFNIKKIFV